MVLHWQMAGESRVDVSYMLSADIRKQEHIIKSKLKLITNSCNSFLNIYSKFKSDCYVLKETVKLTKVCNIT